MTEQEKKHALRREMLKKRAALTQEFINDAESKNIDIIINFLKLKAADSEKNDKISAASEPHNTPYKFTIMSYMSYKNEFPTHKLNKKILENDWQLVLPYTDSNFNIIPCIIESYDSLVESPLGIPEPVPALCKKADIKDIDIIIMPGVAFDLNGNRIGFGKGCYDRFLADPDADPARRPALIALAYEMQLTQNVPAEPTDIPCDMIITEDRIIYTAEND